MASFSWIGGAGNFDSPDSWDASAPDTNDPSGYGVANVAPSAADDAAVDTEANISGSGSAYYLFLDSTITISGTYSITGIVLIDGAVSASGYWSVTNGLNIGFDASGSLTIGAGDAVQVKHGDLSVGYEGKGTLQIDGGGTLESGTPGGFNFIGNLAGVPGSVSVDGDGSRWTSASGIYVGWNGSGRLSIANGGTVNAAGMNIGYYANETGAVAIAAGGQLITDATYENIGAEKGATGEITIDGDDSEWTNTGTIFCGDSGMGSLVVSDGGDVDETGALFIAFSSGGVGAVTIETDGHITDDGQIVVGYSGSGTLKITSGGTLESDGPEDVIAASDGSEGTVTVAGADSFWKSAGAISIGDDGELTASDGGEVQAAGGLYITEGSTLAVDGASTIEAGDAGDATAGSITIDSGSFLKGSGTVTAAIVNSGAVVARDGTLTLEGPVSGKGVLKIADDSTLALEGNIPDDQEIVFNGTSGDLQLDCADPLTANIIANEAGDYDVTLGNGNDSIALSGPGDFDVTAGAGTDTISITNDGDNTVTGGSGSETITFSGAGDNTFNGVGGNYKVSLGAGSDTVTINGDGSSNVAAGSGNDAITLVGNGNNSISLGSGTDTVKISGTGNNTISDGTGASDLTISQFSGQLTGSSDPVIEVTSDSSGSASIGSGDTLELINELIGPVTFGEPGGKLEIAQSDIPVDGLSETLNGFASGDIIDFLNQPNLTTTVVFGHPDELEVCSGTIEIATLTFGSAGIVDTLVPQNDGRGGTEIIVEPVPVGPQLLNPTGTQIEWSYIQNHEKLELVPYVPKGSPDTSGVTVGYGVDLAHSFNASYFATSVFPSYASNPNLVYLYGAVASGWKGPAARTYLAEFTGQTITIDKNAASKYVSLTTYDANQLTYEAELYKLSAGPGTQSLIGPSGYWSTYGFGSFNNLPALAQTALYDLFYNGLIIGGSKIAKDFVTAAESVSPAAPLGASSAWASLATDLFLAGGVNATRKIDDGDLIFQLIVQILGQATNITVPTIVPGGTATDATTPYSILETSLNTLYGFDPSGSQSFILNESSSSPNFASVVMPSSWDGSFLLSYETGSTWSSPQQVQPLQAIALPTGVDGLQVTLLESNGDPVTSQNDFTFFVTFASVGTFSGTVTSPSSTSSSFDLTKGIDTITSETGNNTIIATSGTLSAGDQIDGGDGSNTLTLEGSGTFDLALPATLTNVQTITATEGQAAYSSGGQTFTAQNQIIVLRAGLDATVNVQSDPSLNANDPKPATITIVGAANSDVINLASGNDVDTVGGPEETVNLGSGNDTINVNAATIGATIGNGTGLNTLDVSGGGSMTMGANVTDIAEVLLSPASTAYHFAANAISGLTINDGSTTKADVLTAGGAHQTLTGGGAGKVELIGATAGDDTFKDAFALFNGDTVSGFGANGDVIDLTDISSTGLKPLSWSQTTDTYGKLTVSDGVHTAAITLLGQFTANGFHPVPDGGLGTAITYPPMPSALAPTVSEHA